MAAIFVQGDTSNTFEDDRLIAVCQVQQILKSLPIIIIEKNVSFFNTPVVDMIKVFWFEFEGTFHLGIIPILCPR